MDIRYYRVTVNAAPFESNTEYEIGCYINNELAKKVWDFLYQVNDNKNIEIKIRQYVGKCDISNTIISLINIPKGFSTIIHDKLDRKEYLRLININIPENNLILYEINF